MDKYLIEFTDKPFQELSLDEWYAISNLRERVFVVEQNCPYLDADGKDVRAHHIIGQDFYHKILAYARIVHPTDQLIPWSKIEFYAGHFKAKNFSQHKTNNSGIHIPGIGRVVLDKSIRGEGWGDRLMEYTIASCLKIFKTKLVFISAQEPLLGFYNEHGFVQSGLGYLEDGISHVPMVYGFDL